MDLSLHYRVVFEQALCHASLLIERLLFYNRHMGLLPRTPTASDPLGPMVVSDEDVATIFSGFRKLSRTEPLRRQELLVEPLSKDLAESRAALVKALMDPSAEGLGFVEIVRRLDLLDSALDPFLLAIAPEWDPRLGRLFGFLNNDTTRQRPTYGHLQLALQQGPPMVSMEALGKIDRYLLRPGLIELDSTGDMPQANQFVRVPAHIIELSFSTVGGSAPGSPVREWKDLYWAEEDKESFAAALRREMAERPDYSRLIILEGTPGSGRCSAVRAAALSMGMISIECALRPEQAGQLEREITTALFRAKVAGAALVLRSDGVCNAQPDLWRKLSRLARTLEVRCVVLVRPDEALPTDSSAQFIRLSTPLMLPTHRRTLWESALATAGLRMAEDVLRHTSMHFDITPGRVHELISEMSIRRGEDKQSLIAVKDVGSALRSITVQKLKDHAALYVADQDLGELILDASARERLEELIHRMKLRFEVLDRWHFGGRSMRGYGVTALFAGPPGTGKTAAAGAVAKSLGLDLYIVDLSRVMSKWVGETEQNLARVFDEAEASSVALLFDEADSLFGKRSSEVKSASDRYANITVNYLLQRMERYRGLAILTTNLESAIDTAFSRRIATRVYFADPDEEHRLQLWHQLLPQGVRFDADVDLSDVVRLLEMPGARIRSALMRAAFRAAASGRREQVLTQNDVYAAALLEYEDMGRLPPLPSAEGAGEGEDAMANEREDMLPEAGYFTRAPTRPAAPHPIFSNFPFPKKLEPR